MNIFIENAKIKTNRGFSVFARNLIESMTQKGHKIVSDLNQSDIHLAFVFNVLKNKKIPLVQRLDGIYFNPNINYKIMNSGIRSTFNIAQAVIVQSKFDKKVVSNFWKEKPNMIVINNGTNIGAINNMPVFIDKRLDRFENIWMSSGRWIRKNKRLQENIRYFMEHSSSRDGMIIDGDIKGVDLIKDDRISYFGELPWESHIGLMKRASKFIHLAMVDHCPNVVVEARACNCNIICSSLGGVKEIAGENAIVIQDMEWDFKTPFDYTNPPKMDFSKKMNIGENNSINIEDVANKYLNVFKEILL